ncbi:tetratricopeptide repeat protein [Desulfonatronovibrio magnus]|uniref:tetratricopeptide repeat protein n=1 Tax=Desulfonatronovibrio magnus TaxID=698827 RepID=UPI0005EB99D9|nr:tetratricopeptide repeat protein [Desulfonatronovibrio magnus]
MSHEITKARKNLNNVASMLKQDKILPAATAFNEGLSTYLRSKLLQNEKKEFADLLDKTLYLLNNHPKIREVFPILLTMEPGKEKELLENIRELIQTLQNQMTDSARLSHEDLEKEKKELLNKAKAHLDDHDVTKAEAIFRKLMRNHDKDFDLKINIVDLLIEAQEYQKAIDYLKLAYKDNPKSVHIYNRLGMALRKLGKYEDSEKAYKQAVKISPRDEYLHFNLGRLYIEMQQWVNAMDSAEKAIKINPDFKQAKKMLKFSQGKVGNK